MTLHLTTAREVVNPTWSLDGVQGQYSDCNSRADLYRSLRPWLDTETYLNIGYSRPGQRHLSTNTHLRLIDRMAEGLLALHRAGPHAAERRLLDVGSGRGGPAVRAHQRYGLEVVGIDVTPYNAARAVQNAREAGAWPRVRFGLGDAHRLPIATASFSLAWSIEAPAHFADKPAFLCELSRVVKPGGAVTFSDLAVVENVALSSPGRRRIYEAFLRAWDVPYLETWQSYHQAIAAAGFEIRRAEIVTRRNLDIWRQYCRVYMWVYRLPGLYRFCARYLENRTGADMENVHEHVIRSYEALRLGMIDYPIFWMVRR